jgi:chromosome segregation ATPase
MVYSTEYRLSLGTLKRLVLGTFIIAMSLLAGCNERQSTPTSTLAGVKRAFQSSILELEAEQKTVKAEFKEGRSTLLAFQTALKSAIDKDNEFAKVYSRWREIQGRISVLYDKFLGLVDGADRVYTELANRANRITDPDLKTAIQAELQASIERYAARLKVSKTGIDRLRAQATKVTDVMSALEVRFTLKVVEDELGGIFKDIDETVEAVMAQLEALIEESKRFPTASPLAATGG